ncbi:MAG: hypothetical protein JXR77_07230, partial [Lentisphaeria bacterium]|nr:hypothetical protein [Lentisphaeria bacterium]
MEGGWTDTTGACWLGANSWDVTGTLGVEGQLLVEWEALDAGVGIYAGGTGSPAVQVCPEWAFEGVAIRGYIGLFAYWKLLQYSEEVGWETTFGDGGGKAMTLHPFPAASGGGSWVPIGTDLVRWGDANRIPVENTGLPKAAPTEKEADEETVIENVTEETSPSLLLDASGELILFSLYDVGKPWYEATDIAAVSRGTGQASWTLNRVTDDAQAEFDPSVVQLDGTTSLGAWTRVAGDISAAEDPDDIAPHLEIVAALLDRSTGTWGTPQQITDNAVEDRAPQAVHFGARQGVLWIQKGGVPGVGDCLVYAGWSGTEWDVPVVLWSAQQDILSLAFVADGTGEAHAVLSVDPDGDPETPDDRELYHIWTETGVWQAAQQLTGDALEDALPTLVAPSGTPMVVWRRGGLLHYSTLSVWEPVSLWEGETVPTGPATIAGATLPGGAAVAYTMQGENGMDIAAAFYDAALDTWSLPRDLTDDEHAEGSLSVAEDNGDIVIAYLKTQTVRADMEVEIEGVTYTVPNVPQPARTDLCILRHTPGIDLGLREGSLRIEPPNPSPGGSATVRVMVENLGESPVEGAAVALYDGDPAEGGTQLDTAQLVEVLSGGGAAEVSFPWAVPADPNSHRLFVVCDPALVFADRERTNNVAAVWTVLPDLAIETCDSEAVSATATALTVRVRNSGVIPTGAFTVSWHLDSPTGEEIGRMDIPGLDGVGQAYEGTAVWDYAKSGIKAGYATAYAVVDPDGTVMEADETDNVSAQSVQVLPDTGEHIVAFGTDGTPGAALEGVLVQTVNAGGDCTAVTAVPPEGWHFVRWLLGEAEYSLDNPLTVTDVTTDMGLTATFAINQYTVTFQPGSHGTLAGGTPNVTVTVGHGDAAPAAPAVTPDACWDFAGWTPALPATITGDVTSTAQYLQQAYTVTFRPGDHGTLAGGTPDVEVTVNCGDAAPAPPAVTPEVGWLHTGWDPALAGPITEDVAATAQYTRVTYTLTYTAGPNGAVTGASPQTVEHGSDGTAVTAVPDGCYGFVQWS